MKKLIYDRSGISIIMVLVALAFVAGGTNYIISLNKKAKVESARARSTSVVEAERKRISTFLANNKDCLDVFNSALATNKPIAALTIQSTGKTLLTTNSAIDLATKAPFNSYYGGVLSLTAIETKYGGDALSGHLLLSYSASTTSTTGGSFVGKKNTVIDIPMYMKVSAGAIQDCYAITSDKNISMTSSDSINTAVESTCKVDGVYTAVSGKANIAFFETSDSRVYSCSNDIKFQNMPAQPSVNFTDCSVNSPGMALKGYKVIKQSAPFTGSKMQIMDSECSYFSSLSPPTPSDTTCPAGQLAYAVVAGVIKCDYPGGDTHDISGCTTGQIINRTSLTTNTCYTVDCSSQASYPGNQFVHSILAAAPGFTCTKANDSICATGFYPRSFSSTGVPDCQPLPVMSGNCPAGQFGTGVSRTGTYNGTLNCTPYTKTKTCASPSNATFLNNLDSNGGTVCTTF